METVTLSKTTLDALLAIADISKGIALDAQFELLGWYVSSDNSDLSFESQRNIEGLTMEAYRQLAAHKFEEPDLYVPEEDYTEDIPMSIDRHGNPVYGGKGIIDDED